MIVSILNLSYFLACHPLLESSSNKMDVFNESCLYCYCLMVALFLRSIPVELKDELGWTVIAIISFNITVSFGFVLWNTVSLIITAYKQYKKRKAVLDHLKTLIKETELILSRDHDDQLLELRRHLDFRKGLYFCIKWTPHRDWLLFNNIDLRNF